MITVFSLVFYGFFFGKQTFLGSITFQGLAYATFFIMLLFVLVGRTFERNGIWGQIGFVIIFAALAFGSPSIAGLAGLSLLPTLSVLGVTLTVGNHDVTWLLVIGFLGVLYFAWKKGSFKEAQQLL